MASLGSFMRYKVSNLSDFECDLLRSLKVKSNGVIDLTKYYF